jgi:hypothetical protein
MAPRYILLGWLLTALTSQSLGLLVLRTLRVRLFRLEHHVIAYLCGSAILSLLVFLLGAGHLLHKGVFVAVAALSVAACVRLRAWRDAGPPLASVPAAWGWLFGVAYAIYGYTYFVHALAPEHSPDGMAYHVTVAARYYRERGFVPWTDNMYANLAHGLELLFTFAYAFGRHSAAALVHWTFLMVLPLLLLSHARRFGFVIPGVFAAIVVFTSPIVGRDGTTAYNDIALAATIFGMFSLLEIWRAERQPALLACAGLLAGFAFAIKYTGAVALAWLLAVVLLESKRLRPALIAAAAAALIVCPWLARNHMYTGNPVAPFFNRWFPNPHFYPDFEDAYRSDMRHFGGLEGMDVFTEPVVRGERSQGLLGPIFLLAPLGLLALRCPRARRLVPAGIVFALPFWLNMGTRFLIPAVPFWALAVGVTLARLRPALAGLALLHAFVSWPGFIRYYGGADVWRLEPKVPVRAALRLVPEDRFLAEKEPSYVYGRLLEEYVPPQGRVFTVSSVVAEAYSNRPVVVAHQSGIGLRAREMLWTPVIPELASLRVQQFRFTPRRTHRIRLVQTAAHGRDSWSVSELRLFSNGRELERKRWWRLRASPNPWDVQRAFDNSRVTRWSTREPMRAGSYIEIDLGRAEFIDRVVVESTRDQYAATLRVEAGGDSGPWVQAGGDAVDLPGRRIPFARRAAIDELKREGFTHLMLNASDFHADDFRLRADHWGIELVAERGTARLYKLN